MLLSDVYRFLDPEEKILPGDQFKMREISDDFWAPVDVLAGHRVRELQGQNVVFRRLIAHEVSR